MRLVKSVESFDQKVGLHDLVPVTVFSYIMRCPYDGNSRMHNHFCLGPIVSRLPFGFKLTLTRREVSG